MYQQLIFYCLLSLSIPGLVMGQSPMQGQVTNVDGEPLIGATLQQIGTTDGVITDTDGKFALVAPFGKWVVSYVGYRSDTLEFTDQSDYHIVLKETEEALDGVVIESSSTFMDNLEPRYNQVILESELLKAACCNLSESFETNASVDVQYTDAVSGTKTIQMLGLDGRYVQINRENVPLIRGLTSQFGLGYVPGTWIQSIDVGKGSGSVVNGYESMTGQLNLEFKKPENSEKLYLNAYVNNFGRAELNANTAFKINEKWSGAFLVHGDYLASEIDRNDDGFMDLPKSRQFNVINRYKYQGERLVSQIGVQVMRDEKAGGQKGFGFSSDHRTSPEWGFSNRTTRIELFGKTGLLFPEKPTKGWGFIYSGSYQQVESGFGRTPYRGEELTFYGNAIYQNIITSSFHQYRTGASVLVDDFDEVYADSAFARTEVVPGAFFEYSWLPGDQFSLVIGNRIDYHNLYGVYYTPRIHARYQLNTSTTLRVAAGRGYRTPNVIAENIRPLQSSRILRVTEALNPEVSWNFGGSAVKTVSIGAREMSIAVDYFYTIFENQMIVDLDGSSDEIRVYNLDGQSWAHSLQVEVNVPVNEKLELRGAYKYYNVQATINGFLQKVPYVPTNRFFFNMGYATKYDKWKADLTYQWIGGKRLPNTTDKPTEFQRDASSPGYSLVNMQVSRGFRWGNIYLGSENLLDFRQDDPIIDPENPFGDQFDASIVWGPVAGRVIYAGARFKIKN